MIADNYANMIDLWWREWTGEDSERGAGRQGILRLALLTMRATVDA